MFKCDFRKKSIPTTTTTDNPGDSGGGTEQNPNDPSSGDTAYNPSKSWFDNIWSALSSIPIKISELVNSVGNFFKDFWTSFTDGLSSFGTTIGDFFSTLGTNLGNWFSSLGTSIGNFFSDLWTNTQNFFSGMVENISNIWDWFTNFFLNLADFLVHIFVPTPEQWSAIEEDYTDLSNTFKNHIPFVTFFSNEVEKVKQEVFNEDFLNLKFSGWEFNLGVIHFKTNDYEFNNVLKAYEPYRMSVRTLLTFVVYAMAFVYIIKYAISYGTTQGLNSVNSSINSKGGTDK